MSPKISVIIPVYGVEKFLQQCIDSLMNQTMSDIEFIFVNDCSPDNCINILRENERLNQDKIKVIDSKENLAQGGARNLGLEIARGKYICFCDSDDLVAPDMYETLYNGVEKNNADVSVVKYAIIKENDKLEDIIHSDYKSQLSWGSNLVKNQGKILTDSEREMLMTHRVCSVWSGMWRRDLLYKNRIRFPEHVKYEDNYWVSLEMCYVQKIAFIDKVCYFYRQSSGSTVGSRNVKHHYDRITIEKMLLNEAKKRDLFERYFDAWEYIYITRYAINTANMFRKRFDNVPVDSIQEIFEDLQKNFPHWRNNKYFREQFSFMRRTMYSMFLKYPKPVIKLLDLRKFISK